MYEFKHQPWEHQRKALEVSWNKRAFAYLCDYGTGKTKITIDNAGILFEQSKLDALFVIAPNEVHERWITEQIPEHLPERISYKAVVWTGKNTQKFYRELDSFWDSKNENKLKIFTMNIEALQSSPRAQAFAKKFLDSFLVMLTVDESTRIKSPSAKRTKFIINQLAERASYRRTLTGNEITRSPFDVYSPYEFLDDSVWTGIPNYHVFQHKYGEFKTQFTYRKTMKAKSRCFSCLKNLSSINIKRAQGITIATCPICNKRLNEGYLPWNVKKVLGNDGKFEFPVLIKYKNMDDLRKRIHPHSILIRKEDCMDLPDKIYSPIYAEMNSEQIRLYQELKKDMITEYNGVELSVVHKIALYVRFQQIVGGFFPETGEQIGDKNPKIERLIYDLEDIDCADPIIIWSRFTVEIQAIAKRLQKEYPNKNTQVFYGEVKKSDRKQIIDDFQNGKVDFFVANPSVAGTGLNLQKAYIHYYFSNSFNAEDRWQSEDRSHRGGQKNNCLYKDIFTRGTIDDTIKDANDKKIEIAEFFKKRTIEEVI